MCGAALLLVGGCGQDLRVLADSTDDLPLTTIDVPSENLADVEGQMVRYPGD